MKKTIHIALASTAALALAACGGSTDASDDAIADTVEMPADNVMTDTPEPVADEEAVIEAVDAEAMEPADTVVETITDEGEAMADEAEAVTE